MSNTNSIREQLTFKAWLQVFLVLVSIAFTALYTMPRLEAISTQVDKTNSVIQKYNAMFMQWIPFSQLNSTIQKVGDNDALIDVVNRFSDDVKVVIQNTSEEPYLSWVMNALNSSDKDRAVLMDVKSRINSIIPTLSPVSANIDENTVTIGDYVAFIEQNILKNFHIKSFSPLGISGVSYGDGKTDREQTSINPIGEFKLELVFQAKNQDIIALLDYLQGLGEPSIFSQADLLSQKPAAMSNPLIVVDTLIVDKAPNREEPMFHNSGRIILKFFVRGSSKMDQAHLLDTFNKRKEELRSEIARSLQECQRSSCVLLDKLTAMQKKIDSFDASFQFTLKQQKWGSIENVYLIGQQIQSLKALSDEFKSIK